MHCLLDRFVARLDDRLPHYGEYCKLSTKRRSSNMNDGLESIMACRPSFFNSQTSSGKNSSYLVSGPLVTSWKPASLDSIARQSSTFEHRFLKCLTRASERSTRLTFNHCQVAINKLHVNYSKHLQWLSFQLMGNLHFAWSRSCHNVKKNLVFETLSWGRQSTNTCKSANIEIFLLY